MGSVDNWWTFPGFRIELVATGLDKPVNVSMAPKQADVMLYVTELYGQIRYVTNDCEVGTFTEGLLNYKPDYVLPGSGESGVTGICVDPNSGDVFASMIYVNDEKPFSRIVRFYTTDGMSVENQEVILDGVPSTFNAHQVQALSIGLDGKLYVNFGDGYDNPEAAQDLEDLRGKVLRMNLDGSVPDDNPIKDELVYARGFRNPFGAAWRRSDNSLYISDNGAQSYDRIARVESGGNYGWPPDMRYGSLFWWTFAQAPTALDFAQDGQFGGRFNDHLFVSLAGPARYKAPLMKGKKIVKLGLGNDGRVLSYDDFVVYSGEGLAMPVGLTFGSDGMYFTDLYGGGDIYGKKAGGNVYRVVKIKEGEGPGKALRY
ncbi:MAG: glucose dehydrogenase [Euryarchaeota archaeon]|nr:glucose dehydrogenase [Euryarchaeota archaeon]